MYHFGVNSYHTSAEINLFPSNPASSCFLMHGFKINRSSCFLFFFFSFRQILATSISFSAPIIRICTSQCAQVPASFPGDPLPARSRINGAPSKSLKLKIQ